MALMMVLCACMALGAALVSVLLFLDARRWAGRRGSLPTGLMYLAAGLFAAAAAGLVYLSYLMLDAMLTIF